jgi:hypothetical protein
MLKEHIEGDCKDDDNDSKDGDYKNHSDNNDDDSETPTMFGRMTSHWWW